MIDAPGRGRHRLCALFPARRLHPLQTEELNAGRRRDRETPQSVALAWLLQRSPNILLIPGTSRRAHLRANVAAAGLTLGARRTRPGWTPSPACIDRISRGFSQEAGSVAPRLLDHFGSASLMSARTRASVSPRQSPNSLILASISWGEFPRPLISSWSSS